MTSRHPGNRKLGATERAPQRETKSPAIEAPAAVGRTSVETNAVENGNVTEPRFCLASRQKRPRAGVDADGRLADVQGSVCKKSRDTAVADADAAKHKSLRGGAGDRDRDDAKDVGGADGDTDGKRNGSGGGGHGATSTEHVDKGDDAIRRAGDDGRRTVRGREKTRINRITTPASVARDRNLPSSDSKGSGARRGASADVASDIGIALADAVVDFFAGSASLAARFVSGDTHTRGGLRRLLARKLAACHARHRRFDPATAVAADAPLDRDDDDGDDEDDDDASDDDADDGHSATAPDRDEGGGGGGGGAKNDFVASVVRRPPVTHRVFVGTSHGPYREFSVRGTETVGTLKARIALRDGVPVGSQNLVFRGRRLQDSKTLVEYRIGDGATVYILGLSGGANFQLSVRTLGKTLTLDVSGSDTVASVKRKIQAQAERHTDHMRLVFRDRDLHDDYTLAEYRISSLDTIDLV